MIQNIAENLRERNVSSNIDANGGKKSGYQIEFANLFSMQKLLVYLFTFMISMVSLGQNNDTIIAPFGIALVAAAISNGIPAIFVFLAGLIGSMVKFGWSQVAIYLLTFAVFLVMYLIKKPSIKENDGDKINLGGYVFISVLIASIVKMAFSGFYIYDAMIVLIYSISTYIFYKIFTNSITVISDYGNKQVFSIEEVIGASLLVAIAVSSIGKFSIFNFSIRNIICIFLVLVLGWRNGALVGSASGITVGIVLGIISDGNPSIIAAYAISGMIAGLLNKFGKIGVIVGFILGNVIIAYSANGGAKNIIMFQEILIAAIGLLALPKKTKINIDDILPKTKLLPEAVGKIEASPETMLKLDSISETISQMSKNYEKDMFYDNSFKIFEHEVEKHIPEIEKNVLYDYLAQSSDEILKDVFDYITREGVLTQNGIVSILAKHNIYILNSDEDKTDVKIVDDVRAVVKMFNLAFEDCKKEVIWQKKITEKNKNMSQELNNVKDAIDDISKGITKENSKIIDNKFSDMEEKIKQSLLNNEINVNDVKIKQEDSGRFVVDVFTGLCDDELGEKCPIKKIHRVTENTLNSGFTIQNQTCGIRQNSKQCRFTFLENDKFVLQTGIAKAKKYTSITSGDCSSQIKLGDGKYLLAISDGMGSGPYAKKNSKIAISMLERLLNSGFDKNTSINLINSAILNANSEEMYATLDIEILDLFAGKAEFLKNAACPTYIKRNRNVTMVNSNSLPAGIINSAKVDCFDIDLQDGDIIVICSDGIIESNAEYDNKELWVKNLLEDIQTDIPERIADIILKESIDNNMGKPRDDMSVIVSKVMKKSLHK